MTTTVRMDNSGIIAIQKAMWVARISTIIADNQYTCYDILELLRYDSEARNIPCISVTTVSRYLREMVTRGMLKVEVKKVRRQAAMKYYGNVKV